MALDLSGGTTLITGASSGLGLEFARRFALRGSNLVLVARRMERLNMVAEEIRASYSVRVEVIVQDLADPGGATRVVDELTRREIVVTSLVNNAGFGTYGPFDQQQIGDALRLIDLNVKALVSLTHALLPQLLEGAGVLMMIASTAAYQPTPGMAVYGASKAFVLSFTESIWEEARSTGLTVLALSPGATRTEFLSVIGSEAATVGAFQTPAQVVDAAFHTLDRRRPGPSTISGSSNKLSAWATRLFPRRMIAHLSGRLLGAVRLRDQDALSS